MVEGERVKFCMKINAGSVNPDARQIGSENLYIRMNLRNRNSQRGASVHNCMFAKENDFTGRG